MIFKKIVRTIFISFLLLVGGLTIWTWAALTYVYSSGERAGYIQKFSKRGWLFKTWEGEMAMVNLPGAMPEKFFFTVRDGDVAIEIEKTLGHRVVLKYDQHRGIPTNIFGETSYFISEVRPVTDAVAPEPLPSSK